MLVALLTALPSLDPRYAKTLTVYHVNEHKFGAIPVNMNTVALRSNSRLRQRANTVSVMCTPSAFRLMPPTVAAVAVDSSNSRLRERAGVVRS